MQPSTRKTPPQGSPRSGQALDPHLPPTRPGETEAGRACEALKESPVPLRECPTLQAELPSTTPSSRRTPPNVPPIMWTTPHTLPSLVQHPLCPAHHVDHPHVPPSSVTRPIRPALHVDHPHATPTICRKPRYPAHHVDHPTRPAHRTLNASSPAHHIDHPHSPPSHVETPILPALPVDCPTRPLCPTHHVDHAHTPPSSRRTFPYVLSTT